MWGTAGGSLIIPVTPDSEVGQNWRPVERSLRSFPRTTGSEAERRKKEREKQRNVGKREKMGSRHIGE